MRFAHRFIQPLQAVHPVFLAALLEKALKAAFAAAMALPGIDFVCHRDLADNPIVGRIHQIRATWVPWGVTNWPLMYARSKALAGPRFHSASVHLRFISFIDSQQSLSNFADDLNGPATISFWPE